MVLYLPLPMQKEALTAFVQPGTLDGDNQYFCEQCNKKCNAHKVSIVNLYTLVPSFGSIKIGICFA